MTVPATVPAMVHFLTVHARWAANQHPAWPEFAADIRDLRATLEAATNRTRKPTPGNAQCFACGGQLRREIDRLTGLEDEDHEGRPILTCRDCGEQYPPQRYALALALAAEKAAKFTDRDGEQWATPAALSRELGRSEHTLRSWAQRGQSRSVLVERMLFLNVEDCRMRDERRAG